MYALAVQKHPQGQEWLYQVKFGGYRCLLAGMQEGDEKLCVAQTGAGRPSRIRRMDAAWSSETLNVCRLIEDKEVRNITRED